MSKIIIIILFLVPMCLVGCNNDEDFPSDGNGTVVPWYGIVAFHYDPELERMCDELKPQWVRIAIDANCKVNEVVDRVKWYRKKGIVVLLCVWDKYNPENTPNLVYSYCTKLKGDYSIIYEIGNENNIEIAPPNENWKSYIEPNRYFDIYSNAHNRIKSTCNNRVVHSGLAGDDNISSYLQTLSDRGIVSITDYWNFHCYSVEQFYRGLKVCKKLDSNKPIIIGEYGTDDPSADAKIACYDDYMNRFTKNGIFVAVFYQWFGLEHFQIYNRPKTIEYMKTHWRK